MELNRISEDTVVDSKKIRFESPASATPALMKERHGPVPRLRIIWSFISFSLTVADVTVIIYLSSLHFSHSSDLIAWLMLLPILLNFIGIFTFLSK
jgi:hypothetical protein